MNKIMNKIFNEIIEKYSKVFKIDLKYFINTGIWTGLTLIIDVPLGLLLSYSIANYLTEFEAGRYFFIISIFNIMSIFALQGFITIITNEFLKKKYEYYKSITKIRIKSCLIGSIITIIFAIYLYISNETLWPYFFILSFALPLIPFGSIYSRYLYSKEDYKKISLIIIVKIFIHYTITIYMIRQKYDLLFILSVFLFIPLIIDYIIHIYYWRKIEKVKKVKKVEKEKIKDGFILSFNNGIELVASNLDKILLPIFFDLKMLAIYAFSFIIPKTYGTIIDKFTFMLFYKKLSLNKWEDINIKVYILIFLNIILTLILYNFIPIIYKLLFLKYVLSIKYAQILSFIMPLSLLNLILMKYYESKNKTKLLLKNNMIGQTILFISYFTLIPYLGIIGAIIARYNKVIFNIIFLIKNIKDEF